MKALNRKPEIMYGQRRVSLQIHKTRTEQIEIMFTKQEIRRRLAKVKSMLEQFDENQEDSPSTRRKQTKIVRELNQFLNLISREARGEIFREKDLEATWEELNTSGDHHTMVIE
jgi:hypothetical protein